MHLRHRITRKSTAVFLLTGVIGMALWGTAQPTYASANTCDCYCSVEGQGATAYPSDGSRLTSADCQEECREAGYSVAACAFDSSQKPQYNVNCFLPDECTSQNGELSKTQPGECKQGMFYCYPDPSKAAKAPLQVRIGDYDLSGDMGEYVSVLYQWLIGIATTIAIVFLMVSGLRWSFGGLSAEQIGAAKKTIANALVGLILLLSTYLILFTVNPHLVNLQVPAFPMIKTVSIVGEGSCGYLKGVWGTQAYLVKNGAPFDSPYAEGQDPGKPYTLANPTDGTNCGSISDVTNDPEGNAVTERTCQFDYCPDPGDRCLATATTGECVSCGEIIPGGSTTPTSSVCSSLKISDEMSGGVLKKANYCFYTNDPHMVVSGLTLALLVPTTVVGFAPITALIGADAVTDATTGTCASLQIDCSTIKTCGDYDNQQVTNSITDDELDDLVPRFYSGSVNIKTICEADPCKKSRTNPDSSCTYEETTVTADCEGG